MIYKILFTLFIGAITGLTCARIAITLEPVKRNKQFLLMFVFSLLLLTIILKYTLFSNIL